MARFVFNTILSYAVWITIFVSGLSTPASAHAQNSCTALTSPSCSAKDKPLVDAMKALCEQTRTTMSCDKLFNSATEEERKRFFSCDNPNDLCEQIEGVNGSKLFGCAEGVGGVVYEFGVGLIKIPSDIWHLYSNLKKLPKALRDCPKTVADKKLYLGELKPADMTDQSLDRMSCGEMQKFARLKVDVVLARIEARRQNLMATTGNDQIQIMYNDLSAAEKHAVDFDLQQTGALGKARCYRPEEAAQAGCYEIGNLTVKAVEIYMGGKGVARLLRSSIPEEAVGIVPRAGRYRTLEMLKSYRGEETEAGRAMRLKVRYLTAEQLQARKLHFVDGLIYDSRGQLVTAEGAIYIMDAEGNFYATTDGTIKHSSMTAGGRVASAGTMTIREGKLEMISRDSGHFEPTDFELQQAIDEFQRQSVDVSRTRVTDFTRSSAAPPLKPGEVPGEAKPSPETIGVAP